jgi:hypothetical protein
MPKAKLLKLVNTKRSGPTAFFDRLTKSQQRELLDAIQEIKATHSASYESLAEAASREFGIPISGNSLRHYVRTRLCQGS